MPEAEYFPVTILSCHHVVFENGKTEDELSLKKQKTLLKLLCLVISQLLITLGYVQK